MIKLDILGTLDYNFGYGLLLSQFLKSIDLSKYDINMPELKPSSTDLFYNQFIKSPRLPDAVLTFKHPMFYTRYNEVKNIGFVRFETNTLADKDHPSITINGITPPRYNLLNQCNLMDQLITFSNNKDNRLNDKVNKLTIPIDYNFWNPNRKSLDLEEGFLYITHNKDGTKITKKPFVTLYCCEYNMASNIEAYIGCTMRALCNTDSVVVLYLIGDTTNSLEYIKKFKESLEVLNPPKLLVITNLLEDNELYELYKLSDMYINTSYVENNELFNKYDQFITQTNCRVESQLILPRQTHPAYSNSLPMYYNQWWNSINEANLCLVINENYKNLTKMNYIIENNCIDRFNKQFDQVISKLNISNASK